MQKGDQIALFRSLICAGLAGIRRPVVQIKATEKDDLPPPLRAGGTPGGGLIGRDVMHNVKAHRLVYHSTLGWRVIKKKKDTQCILQP